MHYGIRSYMMIRIRKLVSILLMMGTCHRSIGWWGGGKVDVELYEPRLLLVGCARDHGDIDNGIITSESLETSKLGGSQVAIERI